MASTKAIVRQTKNSVKQFKGEVEGAERLVYLLEDLGAPVVEEKARVEEMKDQAKRMDKALENDKKYYPDDQ